MKPYLSLPVVSILFLSILSAPFAHGGESWTTDRPYRIAVDLDPAAIPAGEQIPFSVEVDFEKLLRQAGVNEAFDPRSIAVTDSSQKTIESVSDENFHKGAAGKVSWMLPDGKTARYYIYFNTVSGKQYKREYIPIIGIGDNFHYNRDDGAEPLNAGLTVRPASADFDGDGNMDLLSPIIYYNTFGQPPFSLYFWRNIGANEKPVYDDFVRLYDTDGNQIRCHYSGQGYGPIAVADWSGDGLPDLITESFYYRNTGKLNPAGGILFAKDGELPPEEQKGDLRILSYTDHDGDGVSDLFYTLLAVHYNYEVPPPKNFVYTTLYRRANQAKAGEKPVFAKLMEPIPLDGNLNIVNHYITSFYDIDGDGDLDLTGCSMPLDRIPAHTKNCYWLNTAPKGKPPVYGPQRILPDFESLPDSPAADRFGFTPVDNAAYQGLFAEEHDCIRYLQADQKQPPGAIPAWSYRDRGLICQRNARCAVGAFSGVEVCDWENDGDWDFISGDEAGYIWLIHNIGTNRRPVFENPVLLQADFRPMRIERWYYIQDENPEYFLGQTKPQCVDWDSDGDLDIITANNTDRMVYFENIGTRQTPRFAAGVTLRVGLDEGPWALRCRPGIADFDGDGHPDLVTLSKHAYLCLYRQDPAAGIRQLMPGAPLCYTDGKPIRNWNMTAPGAPLALASLMSDYKQAPRSLTQFEACDWDNDGDFDILSTLGESYEKEPALWENAGTQTQPVFKEPVPLRCWGQKIMLCRHEQTYAAVDWFGSGKPDLVCGAESGWFYFFHRSTLEHPAPPVAKLSNFLERKP